MNEVQETLCVWLGTIRPYLHVSWHEVMTPIFPFPLKRELSRNSPSSHILLNLLILAG